jgi:hypothetical protein
MSCFGGKGKGKRKRVRQRVCLVYYVKIVLFAIHIHSTGVIGVILSTRYLHAPLTASGVVHFVCNTHSQPKMCVYVIFMYTPNDIIVLMSDTGMTPNVYHITRSSGMVELHLEKNRYYKKF